jgi:hypothetical protein
MTWLTNREHTPLLIAHLMPHYIFSNPSLLFQLLTREITL